MQSDRAREVHRLEGGSFHPPKTMASVIPCGAEELIEDAGNDSISRIIGRNIRRQRLMGGLTQTAVAEYLGISFQQIQRYENGTNVISCEKLILLAKYFRCSLQDLVHEAEDDAASEAPLRPVEWHMLWRHFRRIRSQRVRSNLCSIVGSIADMQQEEDRDTGDA